MSEQPRDPVPVLIGLIVAAGLGLTLISSVQPFFDSAYRLEVGLVAAGIIPYLVLGGLGFYLHDRLTAGAGALVLLIHAGAAAYGGNTLLYWIPPILGMALLALLPRARRAARFPRREPPKGEDTPDLTKG